jgi:Na+-translocating ferredoxin:NAD+ oxidoreductase RnfG subunit
MIAAVLSAIAGLLAGAQWVPAQEKAMPDSNSSSGEVITQVLKKIRSGEKIAPSEFQEFVKAQNEGATTGLKIGEKIPDFALADQNGNRRTFRDLTGPSGLLLVFSRSADW